MRPIKLVMKAFGPYLKETEVDFTKLGSGIVLITGDTGAGKTSIFDAISYALFGEISGEGRNTKNIRSDYADINDPTYVEFTFSHRGKEYIVRRNPEYTRASRKGGGTAKESQNALLRIQGEEPVEGSTPVDKKIKDTLGIDHNQFKQISMMAQGEFSKLLNAESKDREKIFSTIFGTESYKKIVDILKERSAAKQVEYHSQQVKIYSAFSSVEYGENREDTPKKEELVDNKIFTSTANEIKDTIISLIDNDENKRTALKTAHEEKSSFESKKNKEFTLIENNNKLFDELDEVTRKKEELENQSAEFDKKRILLEKQKHADNVREAYKEYKTAANELKNEKEKLTIAQNKAKAAIDVYNGAFTAREEAQAKEGIAEEKKAAALSLKKQEEKYEKRDILRENLKKENKKIDALKIKKAETEAELERLKASVVKAKNRLEEIGDVSVRYAEEKNKLDNLKTKITDMENLSAETENINKLKAEHKDKGDKYENANNAYNSAYDQYRQACSMYERSQAGLLAQELKDGMPCPVCGSLHHPDPAKHTDDDISKEKLDKLEKDYQQAGEKKNQCHAEAVKANEAADQSVKSFIGNAKRLLGREDIEDLETACDILAKTLEEKKSETEKLTSETIKLENEQKESNELNKDLEDYAHKQEQLSETLAKDEKSINESEKTAEGIKGKLSGFDDLTYDDPKAAQSARKALEDKANEILNAIEEAKKAEIEAMNRKIEKDTVFKKLSEQITSSEKKLKELDAKYTAIREENGFKDETEFLTYLKDRNVSEKLEHEISEYDGSVRTNKELYKNAVEKTNGKERKDASAAKQELEAAKEAVEKAYQELMRCEQRINQNRKALNTVTEVLKNMPETEAEANRLENLRKLTDGKLTNKKVSLESYVLMSYFENMIHAANTRLTDMSGGQYELRRHDITNSTNTETAFRLDVLDNYTGKVRPVSTLSGGESFMAALSLALGLSDTVKADIGGIDIEALFIDEGFGTLDENALSEAINVLRELSTGNKLVGVISHRQELKEDIAKKIIVSKSRDGGSRLEIDLGD